MAQFHRQHGHTVVELAALIFIGVLVLGIAIPKFIMASHLRKAKEVTTVLNRLWDAQYEYFKEHKRFAPDVTDLDVKESDLDSKWFTYSVTCATTDTFFVKASVKRPFGLATTDDWAGISSVKIRSISRRDPFGKYAVEWRALMKKDEKRRKRELKKAARHD